MGKGKRGTNMLGFIGINHLRPSFHKNIPHTDTFQINKITSSWSIMRESAKGYLIWNQCQMLVLVCFLFLCIQLFLYFASFFSSFVAFFGEEKDYYEENFALLNTFLTTHKIQLNWHRRKYHINPSSRPNKPHQTKMSLSTNYS